MASKRFTIQGHDYTVDHIFYDNQTLRVSLPSVSDSEDDCSFPYITYNVSIRSDKFNPTYSDSSNLFLLFNCSSALPKNLWSYKVVCGGGPRGLAMFSGDGNLALARRECNGSVLVPVDESHGVPGERIGSEYLELLKKGFEIKYRAPNCSRCERSGGRCGCDPNTNDFQCFCTDRPHFVRCQLHRKSKLKVILATVIPGVFILLLALVVWYTKKLRYISAPRNISLDPSKSDLGGGSICFGVPVFCYKELAEATDNFNPSNELGDGGFGVVYYGKLKDGREVAVKRLYEHNYKRVTQFMNEIEILTRRRHPNLVTLYGCTSPQSRGLLLVYEYIPNGTVADHLHGHCTKDGALTWPVRMNIAIETAAALAYLHASDIIHRDVKTTNILLDDKFCVKVADFGLSRLFPNDVTHVSTAPQGTPGYVDPEYHLCYQLTGKSDVYSFGVVLIELISSMPAVDIGRHRHEINLANFAMNRIQKRAFSELIDPWLGFESDSEVERMTTSVAEVAFRCLQLEKEWRPTMDEVLQALKDIQEYRDENDDNVKRTPPPSPENENVVLLKNSKDEVLASPGSVTDVWLSCSTTSNPNV